MDKLYCVQHEIYNDEDRIALVRATSESNAIMKAGSKLKDRCKISRVVCIAIA